MVKTLYRTGIPVGKAIEMMSVPRSPKFVLGIVPSGVTRLTFALPVSFPRRLLYEAWVRLAGFEASEL